MLIELMKTNECKEYFNAIHNWVVTQHYPSLDIMYHAWNASSTLQRFFVTNVWDKEYKNAYVGKYFTNSRAGEKRRNPVTDLFEVGSTHKRQASLVHNWTKDPSVAKDFSKVQTAGRPGTVYEKGFWSHCKMPIKQNDVVCDCSNLLVFFRTQMRDAEFFKLAKSQDMKLILDLVAGNDMMVEEREVLVDGTLNESVILGTWRDFDGKVDKKGTW